MNKSIVIYQSKYGYTKKYALALAEALGCPAVEKAPADLERFDTILFGSGLYAGGISGIKELQKYYEKIKDKNLILFTVGLADPANGAQQYEDVLSKNLTLDMRQHIRIFHLRGGIDYSRLGFLHKQMMKMMKSMIQKKQDPTAEDHEFLATYGKTLDFFNPQSMDPIIKAATK